MDKQERDEWRLMLEDEGAKFFIVKTADIFEYLSDVQLDNFNDILFTIDHRRRKAGKKENAYLVVNESEPYASKVLALMQAKK